MESNQERKITVILLLLVLILGLSGTAKAGLISYFSFEGSAIDTVGNYDGTVYGSTLTTGYRGGEAYSFDGDDYISVPLDINPSAIPTLTMGAWVKIASETNPVNQQVISHGNGGRDGTLPYDRTLGYDRRGNNNDADSGWSAFTGSTDNGVMGEYPVMLNEWTFIAVVYDQPLETVTLYVDGDSKVETGILGEGLDYLTIGRNPTFYAYFRGEIDDVFFFDEALTTSQLDNIMENGVMPTPEPTTILLLGSGLIGLAGSRRKMRK